MGRSPCCEKVGLKKGSWTPEEDQKLLAYIQEHSHGSWRALPAKAGDVHYPWLQRCGKSCRLRWTNYLRPDIKRGKFSLQEEQTIIQLHALLGNRWSAIATHLSKRTDNEIKNYWNTHLKKRLTKTGIDTVTHKPKTDALSFTDGQSKTAANLSHMAQWETARLEAEARLVRESKLRSISFGSSSTIQPAAPPLCLDVLKAWQGGWSKSTKGGFNPDLEFVDNPTNAVLEYQGGMVKEEGEEEWKVTNGLQDVIFAVESSWPLDSGKVETGQVEVSNFMDGFLDQLPSNADYQNVSERDGDSNNGREEGFSNEKNKNFWNNILNMVNSSSSDSPVF
ncbi:hypothetical protein NE237_006803 [Protea cynaroides]|uniref:Uncharacterized protein n=1 Tax=Protea cynaroides TaxID=273540 RepID=A0A9Q0KNV2_9MAGN|nr:hypothetical protein NE237_006803 [Protea cynaroides]